MPTSKLRLSGSWLANERGDDLAVTPGRPDAPAWLPKGARAVYDAMADRLAELPGLLTMQDGEALAQLAAAVIEFRELSQQLAVEGYTVETAEGGIKAHPSVYIRQQAWNRCKAGWAHFGLTPADRASLKLEPTDRTQQKKAIGLGAAGGGN